MFQIYLKSQQAKEAIPTKKKTLEGLNNRSPYKKHGIDTHAFLELADFSLFDETRGEKKKKKEKPYIRAIKLETEMSGLFLLNYPT